MASIINRKKTRNYHIRMPHYPFILSPVAAPIIPLLMLIVSIFIPQQLYVKSVQEPDYIFLNFNVLVFVFQCVVFYMLGQYIGGRTKVVSIKVFNSVFYLRTDVWFLIPTITSLVALSAYLYMLLSIIPAFSLLVTGHGQEIMDLISVKDVPLQGLPLLVMAVAWFLRYKSFSISEEKYRRRVSIMVYILSIFLLITFFLELNRAYLVVFLLGLMVLSIYQRNRNGHSHKIFQVFLLAVVVTVTGVLIFVIFSMLRGADTFYKVIGLLFGYGPASYNRLAALLSGNLSYKYGSTGYFLIPITHLPIFGNDLNSITGFPSPAVEYFSEFKSISLAGLNMDYQWATLFGYVYSSAGFLSGLYFLVYGLVVGRLWNGFTSGRHTSIVLYPWAYCSVMLWFTYNIFIFSIVPILLGAIAMGIYDLLFKFRLARH
jgi:hypothetical protein